MWFRALESSSRSTRAAGCVAVLLFTICGHAIPTFDAASSVRAVVSVDAAREGDLDVMFDNAFVFTDQAVSAGPGNTALGDAGFDNPMANEGVWFSIASGELFTPDSFADAEGETGDFAEIFLENLSGAPLAVTVSFAVDLLAATSVNDGSEGAYAQANAEIFLNAANDFFDFFEFVEAGIVGGPPSSTESNGFFDSFDVDLTLEAFDFAEFDIFTLAFGFANTALPAAQQVPEPSTIVLFLTGLAGLAFLRRAQRQGGDGR